MLLVAFPAKSPSMDSITIHLHRAAPEKPAVGAPCNGCGICCALETCPAGRLRFWRTSGPCPALEWSDSGQRYHCGLLLRPGDYLPIPVVLETFAGHCMARWIAAGVGCDCDAEVQS